MVVKKSEAEKKETCRARDHQYYEKKWAAKPEAVKPKVNRKLSNRQYYQKKKARLEQNGVETNLKTTGESDIQSGVASGGNNLVRYNVDAFNSTAVESARVATKVTELHRADSAVAKDYTCGNGGYQDMRTGAVEDAGFNLRGNS
jgi:hypothetical protein